MTLSILIFMSAALAIFSLGAVIFFSLKVSRSHYSQPSNGNFKIMLSVVVAFVVTSVLVGLALGFKKPLSSHQTVAWQVDSLIRSVPVQEDKQAENTSQQHKTALEEVTRTGRSISFVGLIEPLNVKPVTDVQFQNNNMILATSPVNNEGLD